MVGNLCDILLVLTVMDSLQEKSQRSQWTERGKEGYLSVPCILRMHECICAVTERASLTVPAISELLNGLKYTRNQSQVQKEPTAVQLLLTVLGISQSQTQKQEI